MRTFLFSSATLCLASLALAPGNASAAAIPLPIALAQGAGNQDLVQVHSRYYWHCHDLPRDRIWCHDRVRRRPPHGPPPWWYDRRDRWRDRWDNDDWRGRRRWDDDDWNGRPRRWRDWD
jgi:hypothetical protein